LTLAEAQDLFAALVTGERPVDPAAREGFYHPDRIAPVVSLGIPTSPPPSGLPSTKAAAS